MEKETLKFFLCAKKLGVSKYTPPPHRAFPKRFYSTHPPSPGFSERASLRANQADFTSDKPFWDGPSEPIRGNAADAHQNRFSRHENGRIGGVKSANACDIPHQTLDQNRISQPKAVKTVNFWACAA